MPEPTEEDDQRRRADGLRARIEDLRRGIRDPSRPESPREFTDNAANEAANEAASRPEPESGDATPDDPT